MGAGTKGGGGSTFPHPDSQGQDRCWLWVWTRCPSTAHSRCSGNTRKRTNTKCVCSLCVSCPVTPGGPTGGGAAPQPCDPVPELPSNGSQTPERGHVAAAAHILTGETHLGLEKLTRDGVSERGPKTKWPGSEPPRKRPGPLERKRKGQGRGSWRWLEVAEATGESSANRASVSPSVKREGPSAGELAGELLGEEGGAECRHPSTSSAGVGRHVPRLAQGHPGSSL